MHSIKVCTIFYFYTKCKRNWNEQYIKIILPDEKFKKIGKSKLLFNLKK